jgi:hypothetical protein
LGRCNGYLHIYGFLYWLQTQIGIEEVFAMELKWKKIALFAGGVIFGTAGFKVLGSDDAKKIYANCTAAVLRAKDCVMKTTTKIQENAEDILAEAEEINKAREKEEFACECTQESENKSENI